MATDITNVKCNLLPFSKACSTSVFLILCSFITIHLVIQLESWKSLIPLPFTLTSKLNNPSCAHYSEYHSISSIQASIFFFLKTMVSVCKSYPPLQVWILLIHSQNAAWDFFVRCKSEHVSPYCLQDKVPTHLHGRASFDLVPAKHSRSFPCYLNSSSLYTL